MTRAYLRGLARESAKEAASPRAGAPERRELAEILSAAGVVETHDAPRLLPAAAREDAPREPLMSAAMRLLSGEDAAAFFARSEELAYLANVLAAGCSYEGRRMRPAEAVRAAVATCSLGLELSLARARDPARAGASLLRTHTADGLFRAAWRALEHDVRAPAAKRKPDLARMEPAAADALRALMDDCPHLAGALAVGEDALIARASQLAEARAFLRALGKAPR